MERDWLYQKYIIEELSVRQVAVEAGCSPPTIIRYMKRYNISRRTKSQALSGERNPMFGVFHSEETRKKMSSATCKIMGEAGRKEEWSRRFSGKGNPMYGRSHSEETKRKMSNREFSTNTRKKMSNSAQKRANRPEEKLRRSKIGKKWVGDKNPFYGKAHSEETRKKIKEDNTGRFRGENGANWQGGITDLNRAVRGMAEYKDWRFMVFQRDKYTCQGCGQIGRELHADHIKAFSILLKENDVLSVEDARACNILWDISNGRTLCVKCHRQTENYAGRVFQKVLV